MTQLPALISASCVTLYWSIVIIKLIKLSPKIGKSPNVIPRERLGKQLRLLWAPIVLAWIIQTWMGVTRTLLVTSFEKWIPYIGASLAVIAMGLTLICWHKMGTSWRIGIDPNEKTQLIVTGPYHYVRHPIYSLSMILAIGSFLTVPTLMMLLTISIHICLLIFEAIREEQYLIKQHGNHYTNYLKNVGRFVPKCSFIGKSERA